MKFIFNSDGLKTSEACSATDQITSPSHPGQSLELQWDGTRNRCMRVENNHLRDYRSRERVFEVVTSVCAGKIVIYFVYAGRFLLLLYTCPYRLAVYLPQWRRLSCHQCFGLIVLYWFVCLSVCWSVGLSAGSRKNCWTGFHETWMEDVSWPRRTPLTDPEKGFFVASFNIDWWGVILCSHSEICCYRYSFCCISPLEFCW